MTWHQKASAGLATSGLLLLLAAVSGCDPAGDNEREFLRTAKPGTEPAFPEVTDYAARKGVIQDSVLKAKAEARKSKKGARR